MTAEKKMTMNEAAAKGLLSMDIAENKRTQLEQLFPEAFAEGKIDFDQLRRVLGDWVEPNKERYGLNWPGKAECMKVIQSPSIATLKPVRKESVNFDDSENLFIEGDNLEVLKLLQKAYFGKVKMIYIDPPYNTGKEFIYPDKYQENIDTYLTYTGQADEEGRKFSTNTDTGGRYHSNWLTMMYPRLYLSRNLLTDDGLIFISIDDNEQANLKLLCDLVFGEENFRGKISRNTGTPSGQGYDILVKEADYIFVYSKSSASSLHGAPLTEEDLKIYDKVDAQGRYLTRPLRKTGGEDRREDRPTMYFPVEAPDGTMVYPIGPTGYESRWRCGPDTYRQHVEDGRIEWKKSWSDEHEKDVWTPYQKFYAEGKSKQPSNLWLDLEGNKKASIDVKNLFQNKIFDFPKPIELVEKCIEVTGMADGIVLDFFAGSATTAHSVMRYNSKNRTNVRYIMVQLPEPCEEGSEAKKAGFKTIADIARERIRRASSQFLSKNEKELALSGGYLKDYGFKSFYLSASNFLIWDGSVGQVDSLVAQLQLHIDHIDRNCASEDILYELLLKAGFELTTKIEKRTMADKEVYSVADGALLICLDKDITPKLIDAMAAAGPLQVICLDEGFKGNDQLKTNAVQTFRSLAKEDEEAVVFRTV